MRGLLRRNTAVLLFGDIFSLVFGLLLALALRRGAAPSRALFLEHLWPFLAVAALSALVFLIAGLYDAHIAFIRRDVPDLVLKAQVINILLAAFFFFLAPVGITPKTTLALYLVISTTFVVWWRLYLFPMFSRSSASRVVIIGSGDETRELARALGEHPQFGCVCTEVVDIQRYQSADVLQAHLAALVSRSRVDTIIADMSDEYTRRLAPLYHNLAFLHSAVRFLRLSDVYEQVFCRVPLSLIGKTWFLENVSARSPQWGYALFKRACDSIGAFVLLVPCLVLFPFIALAVKLSDGGKVFYKSERVGQYGKSIGIYKFRTMTGMDSAATISTIHVVTPLGRFLRRTRIDELPQLWNILRGDLSFVGPRPETPARAAVYANCIPHYDMRHLVKPGLSGWAQISDFDVPHGEVDIPRTMDKLSFDLFYLKHYSLFFDFEIILKTIQTLLLRSGR